MKYLPKIESIKQHNVPDWYNDAKLGIFIHWGLYSVPAFAVTGIDLVESMKKGLEEHFKNNPYAEWYLNSLRILGSPTQKYHFETYGKDFSYDDFSFIFNKEIKKWNPNKWAELFKKIGAKYVVLTTKHCDGFLLWPSKYPNPNKENYIASRDILDELNNALKKNNIKMGFYYSTAWDWSFNITPIKDASSFLENYINPLEYSKYVDQHIYELIDKYEPMILWADMGYPPHSNLLEIFAYYYNKLPEGVVNDRWKQFLSNEKKFTKLIHCDFTTPEYSAVKKIKKEKWELCRGIGNSFGYNKFETEKDYLTSEQLIHLFIDVVSKNGNLLLNIGPKADGTIPEIQIKRLLDLGSWLEINGEAIFGTRVWTRAEGETIDGLSLRFTRKGDILYAILLGKPKSDEITIKNLRIEQDSKIYLLGTENNLIWKQINDNLSFSLPETVPKSHALSFKIIKN